MHSLKVKNVAFSALVDIAKPSIFTPTILSLDGLASGFFDTGSEWFVCFSRSFNAAPHRNIQPRETCCEGVVQRGFQGCYSFIDIATLTERLLNDPSV